MGLGPGLGAELGGPGQASSQDLGALLPVSPEASAALQVRATKDYCNNYDLTSLNVKAGDIITVRPAWGCRREDRQDPMCSPHTRAATRVSGVLEGRPRLPTHWSWTWRGISLSMLPHLIWPGPRAASGWPVEGLYP